MEVHLLWGPGQEPSDIPYDEVIGAYHNGEDAADQIKPLTMELVYKFHGPKLAYFRSKNPDIEDDWDVIKAYYRNGKKLCLPYYVTTVQVK